MDNQEIKPDLNTFKSAEGEEKLHLLYKKYAEAKYCSECNSNDVILEVKYRIPFVKCVFCDSRHAFSVFDGTLDSEETDECHELLKKCGLIVKR